MENKCQCKTCKNQIDKPYKLNYCDKLQDDCSGKCNKCNGVKTCLIYDKKS